MILLSMPPKSIPDQVFQDTYEIDNGKIRLTSSVEIIDPSIGKTLPQLAGKDDLRGKRIRCSTTTSWGRVVMSFTDNSYIVFTPRTVYEDLEIYCDEDICSLHGVSDDLVELFGDGTARLIKEEIERRRAKENESKKKLTEKFERQDYERLKKKFEGNKEEQS